MKEKKTIRQIVISVMLILADIALFIALVTVLRDVFVDIFGYDIAEYVARDDVVGGFRAYRFGAGCCEYLYLILTTAALIFLQAFTFKKCNGSKIVLIAAIVLHAVFFLLFAAYTFRFLHGENVFWLLRYVITGAEPPF